MPATRLRGQDAIHRALEAHRMHTDDLMTYTELADHYQCSTEAIRLWLKLAQKHTLPPVDDQLGWLERLVKQLGGRLEDARDQDAVRLAHELAALLGIGSAEVLKQQAVQIEAAKIALIAQAFDRAISDLPDVGPRRAAFAEVLNELGVAV